MVQGELFRDDRIASVENEEKRSFLFGWQLTLTADKVLIGTIALLVLFLLTYSLGVERGKRVMEGRFESLFPTQGETLSPMTPLVSKSRESDAAPVNDELVLVVEDTAQEETVVEPLPEDSVGGTIENQTRASAFPLADAARKSDFTVQLVTYLDEADAIREVNRLQSEGHQSFVIPSGRYLQVCANYFTSRSKARSALSRFQATRRYPDAYIRPVVR